jgi:hypothetical protein
MNYPEYVVVRLLSSLLVVLGLVSVYGFGVGGLLLQILMPIAALIHVEGWFASRRRAASH